MCNKNVGIVSRLLWWTAEPASGHCLSSHMCWLALNLFNKQSLSIYQSVVGVFPRYPWKKLKSFSILMWRHTVLKCMGMYVIVSMYHAVSCSCPSCCCSTLMFKWFHHWGALGHHQTSEPVIVTYILAHGHANTLFSGVLWAILNHRSWWSSHTSRHMVIQMLQSRDGSALSHYQTSEPMIVTYVWVHSRSNASSISGVLLAIFNRQSRWSSLHLGTMWP